MNSPFANIYTTLMNRIKTEVPDIRWVDFDLGQLEAFDGDRPPVDWPCLLIDFTDTGFEQMQGFQRGNMQIQMRLGFDQYESSNGITPEPILEQALNYLEIEYKLHQAVQAWYGENKLTDAMIRINASSEKRENDNFRVRRLIYNAAFDDQDPR